jgi:BCD family chlorophyll transporter-like MFS transporter
MMFAQRFRHMAQQIPAGWLPFADVASDGLPLPRLLRLSLFKVTMGMTTALLIGTLNRVMIVELHVAASLVSLMLALPMLVAPLRAVTGYQSDTHRSAFGWKRVPFMWGGTLIQFFGLAFMPFALLNLSGEAQNPLPVWLVEGVVALSFLMVGAGLQTSQTAGLALATDQASEETRPRVVALMYVMLLAGAVGGSLLFSVLLADFKPQRLIQVVQGTALLVLLLNAFALWKQEGRNRERAAAMKLQKQEPFRAVWSRFYARPQARRFLWATFLGTMAFNMQDIVLEPYGGEILHLSVGATSALTAMLAGGGLCGFILAGRQLARGMDPLRLAALGTVLGLPAFSAVIFSAPLEAGWLFRAGALGIGFGGGLFAVGTLFSAMRMEGSGFIGLALGAWGAVQSTGAGLAMFLGGALRDGVSQWQIRAAWSAEFADPALGYSVVYHVEMLLLFVTLVIIGPLVRRHALARPLGPTLSHTPSSTI